jgi:16S rRNA (cytidine1402-2'-O)-methyltransferase
MEPGMSGTLYLVATPIGNLEDVTLRALRVLAEVDLIACEDTRHTRGLLSHYAIKTRTISYHEHNERERAAELCEYLRAGKSIAVVSDAGTPLVSDPGFRVVRAAIDEGFQVVAVPGPAAFVAALAGSGLACDQFFFAGFLPPKPRSRRARLEELATIPGTLVFYEAPHRIAATLKDAREVLGDRQAAVARELTKLHEEIARGTLSELEERFSASAPRGEMVLLISGEQPEGLSQGDQGLSNTEKMVARVRELEQAGVESKAALKQAARELGLKRAEAYRLLVAQKNSVR